MGRHRKGRAPMASLLFGLMVLAQVAWVPGGPCVRGPSGHAASASPSSTPAATQEQAPGHHGHHPGGVQASSAPSPAETGDPTGGHEGPHGSHDGCECALSCLACGAVSPSVDPATRVASAVPAPSPVVSLRPTPAGFPAVLLIPHLLPPPNGPPHRV